MVSLKLAMSGRSGLAVAAGAFALLIALPRPAEAGRAASTRSDGGVSSRGTSSGSSSHSGSSGSSGSSSHASGSTASSSSSSGSHDSGRTAVRREGAGEVAGRQPHSRGSRDDHRRHGGGRIHIGGGFYDPWYYGYPYGYGWGFGWRGWWWPWGPGGVLYDRPYHGGRGNAFGALDVDLWPGETEIYVDGERVGTADDFDGFPSYLWLPRGTYDVVFYLPGFQTLARQYSIYDGLVIDVEDRLQRGDAIRPEDLPAKSTVNRDERLRRDSEREEAARRREEWRHRQDEADLPQGSAAPAPDRDSTAPPSGDSAARLRLDVTPDDASVYLDGNFLGTASELEGLSAGLVVAPGSHKLEVVRPGYVAEDLDFEGTPGREVQLKVSLDED